MDAEPLPTYETPAALREAFRAMLEESGAVAALSKVFVALYEEKDKPTDVVAYITR